MPRVTLPFAYRIEVQPPRRKTVATHHLVDTYEFDLRTVDASRARVAARWVRLDHRPEPFVIARRPVECRVFDGRLFVPVWGEHDRLCARHVLDLHARRARLTFEVEPVMHIFGYPRYSPEYDAVAFHLGSPRFHPGEQWRGILLQSSRDSDLETMRDICSRLILFDDEVWREVRMPMIVFRRIGGAVTASIEAEHVSFAKVLRDAEPLGTKRISLADAATLRRHIAEAELDALFDELDVIEPQAFQFDAYGRFLRQVAANAANAAGPVLGDLPASAIEHVLTLRQFAWPSKTEPMVDPDRVQQSLQAFYRLGLWPRDTLEWVQDALDAYSHS